MIKTTEYSQKATKVAYHRASGRVVPLHNAYEGTIVFDSVFEFNVFQLLEKIPDCKIQVHQYVKHLKWYIDFTLVLKNTNKVPRVLQGYNLRPHKGKYLYVDAKGVIDSHTLGRVRKLDYTVQRSLILVSNNTKTTNIGATPIIKSSRLVMAEKNKRD